MTAEQVMLKQIIEVYDRRLMRARNSGESADTLDLMLLDVLEAKLRLSTMDTANATDATALAYHEDCQWENCFMPATDIAMGHSDHPKVGRYCERHAKQAVEEYGSERTEHCPNCGCMFGCAER